jgi:endonuclease-3
MKKEDIYKVFEIFTNNNPNPTTELNYSNPFELLVAVVLSAQTTDVAVNKVTPLLFAKANNPFEMTKLSIDEISKMISSIGLYRVKAKYIKELSEQLVNNFYGEIPSEEKDLTSLSGVGVKTARVVLNTLFNKNVIAVDTHILRVAQRIGLSKAKTPEIMSDKLVKIIPKEFLKDAHHHLILHGRYVCKAKNPLCEQCVISQYCQNFKSNKI